MKPFAVVFFSLIFLLGVIEDELVAQPSPVKILVKSKRSANSEVVQYAVPFSKNDGVTTATQFQVVDVESGQSLPVQGRKTFSWGNVSGQPVKWMLFHTAGVSLAAGNTKVLVLQPGPSEAGSLNIVESPQTVTVAGLAQGQPFQFVFNKNAPGINNGSYNGISYVANGYVSLDIRDRSGKVNCQVTDFEFVDRGSVKITFVHHLDCSTQIPGLKARLYQSIEDGSAAVDFRLFLYNESRHGTTFGDPSGAIPVRELGWSQHGFATPVPLAVSTKKTSVSLNSSDIFDYRTDFYGWDDQGVDSDFRNGVRTTHRLNGSVIRQDGFEEVGGVSVPAGSGSVVGSVPEFWEGLVGGVRVTGTGSIGFEVFPFITTAMNVLTHWQYLYNGIRYRSPYDSSVPFCTNAESNNVAGCSQNGLEYMIPGGYSFSSRGRLDFQPAGGFAAVEQRQEYPVVATADPAHTIGLSGTEDIFGRKIAPYYSGNGAVFQRAQRLLDMQSKEQTAEDSRNTSEEAYILQGGDFGSQEITYGHIAGRGADLPWGKGLSKLHYQAGSATVPYIQTGDPDHYALAMKRGRLRATTLTLRSQDPNERGAHVYENGHFMSFPPSLAIHFVRELIDYAIYSGHPEAFEALQLTADYTKSRGINRGVNYGERGVSRGVGNASVLAGFSGDPDRSEHAKIKERLDNYLENEEGEGTQPNYAGSDCVADYWQTALSLWKFIDHVERTGDTSYDPMFQRMANLLLKGVKPYLAPELSSLVKTSQSRLGPNPSIKQVEQELRNISTSIAGLPQTRMPLVIYRAKHVPKILGGRNCSKSFTTQTNTVMAPYYAIALARAYSRLGNAEYALIAQVLYEMSMRYLWYPTSWATDRLVQPNNPESFLQMSWQDAVGFFPGSLSKVVPRLKKLAVEFTAWRYWFSVEAGNPLSGFSSVIADTPVVPPSDDPDNNISCISLDAINPTLVRARVRVIRKKRRIKLSLRFKASAFLNGPGEVLVVLAEPKTAEGIRISSSEGCYRAESSPGFISYLLKLNGSVAPESTRKKHIFYKRRIRFTRKNRKLFSRLAKRGTATVALVDGSEWSGGNFVPRVSRKVRVKRK